VVTNHHVIDRAAGECRAGGWEEIAGGIDQQRSEYDLATKINDTKPFPTMELGVHRT
jgi:hypothetical protein